MIALEQSLDNFVYSYDTQPQHPAANATGGDRDCRQGYAIVAAPNIEGGSGAPQGGATRRCVEGCKTCAQDSLLCLGLTKDCLCICLELLSGVDGDGGGGGD